MKKLIKFICIIFLVLISFTNVQPIIVEASEGLFELPENNFDVLKIESPEYDSKGLKSIYDFYKISDDLDILEQFEKVSEGMKKNPPGTIVLQPDALDLQRRRIDEFNQLEPIALKRGQVTTISLKFDEHTTISSRLYTVDLEIYLDDKIESGIAYNRPLF